MRARALLLLRGVWLGLLVWPYAVASGVPRPIALAALPFALALLFGDGSLRFVLRIVAALALGAFASMHVVTLASLLKLWTASDPRPLTAFVTSTLLWFTALLGWQVFRDATSRTRLLWLWLMGALVLGLNHRFWGVAADVPTLAYIGIGLFLLGVLEDRAIRWPLALASVAPLLGALVGLWAAPGGPSALTAQDARALNLSGLRVAVTPSTLPKQVDINKPVALPTTPLLSVAGAPRPAYWQEAIYDQFNGVSWVATSSARTPVPLTPPLLPAAASGFPTSMWTVRVTQFFPGTIGPVIYTGTPLILQSEAGTPYEIPGARTLYLPGATSYSLTLSVPAITESALRAATYPKVVDVPPRDLEVPASLASEITPLAQQLKAGTTSPWQLATRIAQYLDRHEDYDPNFSPSKHADPVGRFLLRTHRGYCDQFSTAFIMLARLDGLPARWVVGFAPGTYDAKTRTEVLLAKDAHSWAEVDLAPYGWVRIDPTPSASPFKSPKPPAQSQPTPAQRPPGDLLAAVLVLGLSAAAFLVWRRRPGLHARVARLERSFIRLCQVESRRPPTLRERLLGQPETLQEILLPVLLVLEQARYGEGAPPEDDIAAAESALARARQFRREAMRS